MPIYNFSWSISKLAEVIDRYGEKTMITNVNAFVLLYLFKFPFQALTFSGSLEPGFWYDSVKWQYDIDPETGLKMYGEAAFAENGFDFKVPLDLFTQKIKLSSFKIPEYIDEDSINTEYDWCNNLITNCACQWAWADIRHVGGFKPFSFGRHDIFQSDRLKRLHEDCEVTTKVTAHSWNVPLLHWRVVPPDRVAFGEFIENNDDPDNPYIEGWKGALDAEYAKYVEAVRYFVTEEDEGYAYVTGHYNPGIDWQAVYKSSDKFKKSMRKAAEKEKETAS
jgi:hypothetical protein